MENSTYPADPFESAEKSHFPGLAVFFVSFCIVGVVLGYVYVGLSDVVAEIYGSFAFLAIYAMCLYTFVRAARQVLKITCKRGAIIATCAALLVIQYFLWTFYFVTRESPLLIGFAPDGINPFTQMGAFLDYTWVIMTDSGNPVAQFIADLRRFNDWGWLIGDAAWELRGWSLGLVWLGEFLIICIPPLAVFFDDSTVFLPTKNAFSKKITDIVLDFAPFSAEQVEQLGGRDIDVILSQPIADPAVSPIFSRIGLCAYKDEPVEYIVIRSSTFGSTDKEGNPNYSHTSKPIWLGADLLGTLNDKLVEKFSAKDEPADLSPDDVLNNFAGNFESSLASAAQEMMDEAGSPDGKPADTADTRPADDK